MRRVLTLTELLSAVLSLVFLVHPRLQKIGREVAVILFVAFGVTIFTGLFLLIPIVRAQTRQPYHG